MTDKENIDTKDLEDILSEYFNLRLLQAENRQCYASLQTTLAKIIIIASDIVARSFEVGDLKTLLELDEKLGSSLNKIAMAMYEWRTCKDFQAAKMESEYEVCIRECYFTTGILKAIEKYLEEMKSTKYNKLGLENKIDELTKGIGYLSSMPVLNFLFKKFEEKLEEEHNKIVGKEYSALMEAFDTHIYIHEQASNYIKDLVIDLLKDPKENIEKFNKSIKNTETENYKNNKKQFNMYDTYIN